MRKPDRPQTVDVIYILKHLGFLIALLILSAIAVAGHHTSWTGYKLFEQYLIFACVVLTLGALSGLLGQLIPSSCLKYDRKPFLPYRWERNGSFYQKKLNITSWKDRSFNLNMAFPRLFQKEVAGNLNEEHLIRFLQET